MGLPRFHPSLLTPKERGRKKKRKTNTVNTTTTSHLKTGTEQTYETSYKSMLLIKGQCSTYMYKETTSEMSAISNIPPVSNRAQIPE
jgi:hypothetical protein